MNHRSHLTEVILDIFDDVHSLRIYLNEHRNSGMFQTNIPMLEYE